MASANYVSQALTANGGNTGTLTVPSTTLLVVDARVILIARELEPVELKIASVSGGTSFLVTNLDGSTANLSSYTVAAGAKVTQYAQRDVGAGTAGTYVLRSGDTMTGPLTVQGLIHSTSGGVRFPDGSIQTTAGGAGSAAGLTGYVQFNTSGAFAGDPAFFWDNTNARLGIGTSSPSQKLQVAGQIFSSTGGFRFPDNTIQTTAGIIGIGGTTNGLSLSSGTLSLAAATASQTGALTSADFTTFAAKESALTFSSPLIRTTNTISVQSATGSLAGVVTIATQTFAGQKTFANSVIIGGSTLTTNAITASGLVTVGASGIKFADATVQTTAWTGSGGGGTPAGTVGAVQFTTGSAFAADSSNFFWDNTNKRLGVGTAAPSQPLQVAGQIFSSTGGFRFPDNTVQTTAATGGGSTSPAGSNGEIQFNNSGSFGANSNLYWDNTNSILKLGPNATAAPLVYQMNVYSGGIGTFRSGNTVDAVPIIAFERSRGTTTARTANIATDQLGEFRFNGYTDDRYTAAIIRAEAATGWGSSGADVPAHLLFMTTPDGQGSPTEKMRITPDGMVGVGTNAPVAPFHVKKDYNGSTNLIIENSNGGTDALPQLYLTNGTSGFGIYRTTSAFPYLGGLLQNSAVFALDSAMSKFVWTLQPSQTIDFVFNQSSSWVLAHRFSDTGAVVFNENGADADFRIEGDTDTNLFFTDASVDRVGVGTNTPSQKLQVAGQIFSSTGGFRFPDNTVQTTAATGTSAAGSTGQIQFNSSSAFAADTNLFWDNTNKRLGVGNASPSSSLHVTGSIAKSTVTVAATLTLDPTQYTVRANAAPGAFTVNLPAASGCTGRIYVVKKVDASANTVTIDANASEVIDGSLTLVIGAQYTAYTIQSNGTSWDII